MSWICRCFDRVVWGCGDLPQLSQVWGGAEPQPGESKEEITFTWHAADGQGCSAENFDRKDTFNHKLEKKIFQCVYSLNCLSNEVIAYALSTLKSKLSNATKTNRIWEDEFAPCAEPIF